MFAIKKEVEIFTRLYNLKYTPPLLSSPGSKILQPDELNHISLLFIENDLLN
jgi:hypothetical protein